MLLPLSTALSASEMVSLKDLGTLYEFPPPTRTATNVVFSGKYTAMEFEANSRKLLFNNTLIWLNQPAVPTGSDLSIAKFDADVTIDSLIRLNQRRTTTNNIIIVLDPGHGGKDTGAIGPHKACEKKIVLDIANFVKKRLESPQISVVLTRKWDSALSRTDRVNEARRQKATIFISIHINSAANTSASGVETYIMPGAGFLSTSGNTINKTVSSGNKFDNANIQIAYCVHRQLLNATGAIDRGIRHARFDILQDAPCPAVLIECGFVSNLEEESRLTKRQYREYIAEGIANGILTLFNPNYKPTPTISRLPIFSTSRIITAPATNRTALSSTRPPIAPPIKNPAMPIDKMPIVPTDRGNTTAKHITVASTNSPAAPFTKRPAVISTNNIPLPNIKRPVSATKSTMTPGTNTKTSQVPKCPESSISTNIQPVQNKQTVITPKSPVISTNRISKLTASGQQSAAKR